MSLSPSDLRESEFYLDADPDTSYQGYTAGQTWNGFACPYFELQVAQEVAQAYVEMHAEGPGRPRKVEYDPENDCFRFYEPAYDDWEEVSALIVGEKKLYPIGAFSWAWHEVNSE